MAKPIAVAYLLCDLLTGRVLAEVPLGGADTVQKLIARVETQGFTLPVADPRCPTDWAQLLTPGKAMIVLTLDRALTLGWAVDDVEFGSHEVAVSVSTLETCLARTNVPDLDPYEYGDLDMSAEAAALVAEMTPRFGFTIDWEPSGKPSTTEMPYENRLDMNVLDAINALNAAGGPEWRITLAYTDETRRVVSKGIDIRPRIGTDRPDAVFDLDAGGRGVIDTYRRRVSYATGKGATMLIGTSDGTGSGERPMTGPVVSSLAFAGWPIWEERRNFTGLGQGDVDEDTELMARTAETARQREHGTVTWTITGSAVAPKPGRDYEEGDTVHVNIAPQGKVDPIGGTTALRTRGWSLDLASGRSTIIAWDDGDTDG